MKNTHKKTFADEQQTTKSNMSSSFSNTSLQSMLCAPLIDYQSLTSASVTDHYLMCGPMA